MSLSSCLGTPEDTDRELVTRSLAGDRDAFGAIVGRYQALVGALVYSACGDTARSEDLAQEVFIAAWQRLSTLRDPDRIKPWLCGIARHLAAQAHRRDLREPSRSGDALTSDVVAPELQPTEEAMQREDELLLWRALARLPETYRESLVLYYRENRSIESVAEALDISEENVRQRLSRGRKALQDEVAEMLESTLTKSAPGPQFRAAVLGALPPLAPLGMLKAGFAGSFGSVGGLILPLLGMTVQIRAAKPGEERKRLVAMWKMLWAGCIVFMGGLYGITLGSRFFWSTHPNLRASILIASIGFYSLMFVLFIWRCVTGYVRVRSWKVAVDRDVEYYEYRSRSKFLGLPLVHICHGRPADGELRTARGWIASGHVAYGGLFASGVVAVAPISLGAFGVGMITLSGLGIGAFSFGAIALGVLATGGIAVGYLAWGGCALGWYAAEGGDVWSRNYALGNPLMSIAPHHDGPIAHRVIGEMFFFRHGQLLFFLCLLATWMPLVFSAWRRTRCARL